MCAGRIDEPLQADNRLFELVVEDAIELFLYLRGEISVRRLTKNLHLVVEDRVLHIANVSGACDKKRVLLRELSQARGTVDR
ncbi:MAG: hypothetical protein U9N79_05985 [Actinomycetota bacterium]|nr:hypothetical protein [Actinomycetota bacterium]